MSVSVRQQTPAAVPESAEPGGSAARTIAVVGRAVLIGGGLVLVVLALTTHRFVSLDNARAILSAASLAGIMALGLTLVTIAGSYMSLAIAATGVASAMVFLAQLDHGLAVAIVLAVLAGTVVTALQGLVVGTLGANPIILTIGAAFIVDGVSTRVTGGKVVPPATGAYDHLNATALGLPISVYAMLAVAIALELFLRRTATGRRLYLLGDAPPAARAAGLPTARLTTIAFAIAGATFALGGVFLGAFNRGASQGLEGTLNFDAIAAVLVGGTLISGGRGSALRTLAGAIVIAAISNILLLRGLGTGAQILVKGGLVVAVVLLSHVRSAHRTA